MREQDLCKVLAPVSAPMIEIAEGNILDADADALVNTVNCAGVMGKGLALQFKQAFPANFKAYEAACRAREVVAGTMFIFDNGLFVKPRYIVNFPTKRHWRDNSRIEDIRSGLESLIADVRRLDIRSIAVPPLGCGLGGLNWRDVRPMIENSFSELPDVRVLLFPPVV
jgi:O-acetyl-ADP-ribose deacetylase (regulator of RNase III)